LSELGGVVSRSIFQAGDRRSAGRSERSMVQLTEPVGVHANRTRREDRAATPPRFPVHRRHLFFFLIGGRPRRGHRQSPCRARIFSGSNAMTRGAGAFGKGRSVSTEPAACLSVAAQWARGIFPARPAVATVGRRDPEEEERAPTETAGILAGFEFRARTSSAHRYGINDRVSVTRRDGGPGARPGAPCRRAQVPRRFFQAGRPGRRQMDEADSRR